MCSHDHQTLFLIDRIYDHLHAEGFQEQTEKRIEARLYIENSKGSKDNQKIGAKQCRADIALEILSYDKRYDIRAARAATLLENE